MTALASFTGAVGRALRPSRPSSRAKSVLIVLSHPPYDGDVTWNAIRLAGTLVDQGHRVLLFVMNDATDVVRAGSAPPEAEFDLQAMLRGLMAKGVRIKICTTCVNRCGFSRGEVIGGAVMATMADLATWVTGSDRVVAF